MPATEETRNRLILNEVAAVCMEGSVKRIGATRMHGSGHMWRRSAGFQYFTKEAEEWPLQESGRPISPYLPLPGEAGC